MVKDSWPVIAEDFSQWVVEDNFCNGKPAWDKVIASSSTDRAAKATLVFGTGGGGGMIWTFSGGLCLVRLALLVCRYFRTILYFKKYYTILSCRVVLVLVCNAMQCTPCIKVQHLRGVPPTRGESIFRSSVEDAVT